jgi:hypothetical protein
MTDLRADNLLLVKIPCFRLRGQTTGPYLIQFPATFNGWKVGFLIFCFKIFIFI